MRSASLGRLAGTRGENVTAAGRTTLPGKSTGHAARMRVRRPVSYHDPPEVHHRRAEALAVYGYRIVSRPASAFDRCKG